MGTQKLLCNRSQLISRFVQKAVLEVYLQLIMKESQLYLPFDLDRLISDFKRLFKDKGRPVQLDRGEPAAYRQAKIYENKRILQKAALKYFEAAKNGEKLQSVVKDFASIIHQLGETAKAVLLLEEMQDDAKDMLDSFQLQKYQNLKKNFINQNIEPTGKHNITNLLIDLKEFPTYQTRSNKDLLRKLFKDFTRVQSYDRYDDLNLSHACKKGRYLLLRFSSFSQAKKTLEKFNSIEWYILELYWVNKDCMIVSDVQNGQTEFKTIKILKYEIDQHRASRELANQSKIEAIKNFTRPNWELTEDPRIENVIPFD